MFEYIGKLITGSLGMLPELEDNGHRARNVLISVLEHNSAKLKEISIEYLREVYGISFVDMNKKNNKDVFIRLHLPRVVKKLNNPDNVILKKDKVNEVKKLGWMIDKRGNVSQFKLGNSFEEIDLSPELFRYIELKSGDDTIVIKNRHTQWNKRKRIG